MNCRRVPGDGRAVVVAGRQPEERAFGRAGTRGIAACVRGRTASGVQSCNVRFTGTFVPAWEVLIIRTSASYREDFGVQAKQVRDAH